MFMFIFIKFCFIICLFVSSLYLFFLNLKLKSIQTSKVKLNTKNIKAPFNTTVYKLILNSAGTTSDTLALRKTHDINGHNSLFVTHVFNHKINTVIIKNNTYKITYKYETDHLYLFNIQLFCETSITNNCDSNNITNIIGTEIHVLGFHS